MPPAQTAPPENKTSILLTIDENQQVIRLLGQRCQTLSTTVVQLFETQPPAHAQWIKKDAGVLCFVRDNQRKNYFFRIYCFKRNKLIWEQELYKGMDYIASCNFLHTFEADECIVCFNFANEGEARDMKSVVDAKVLAIRKREVRKLKNNDVQVKNNQNNNMIVLKNVDLAAKKAKRKRNITKADIGQPLEFRHISHVGWDPDKGFDVNTEDAALNDFFQKAGVSESQLKDKETRQFIYDFIAANGGRDAVLEQELKTTRAPATLPTQTPPSVTGPPVPPRGATRSSHSRAAPPPPPSVNQPPPRPPPTTPRASIPPPPAGHAPPPPPPPPPPTNETPPPPPPHFVQTETITSTDSIERNDRSALMESIQRGMTLKPVEIEKEKPRGEDARGDLLCQIRKGFQLKPANEREVKPVSPSLDQGNNGNDLAAALSRALAERNRAIQPDDDDESESSDSNDDEWDA